jgi:hypothetical protein
MTNLERSAVKIAVEKIGGPTKAAHAVGVSNTTIHTWIKRNRIENIDKARIVAALSGIHLELLRGWSKTALSNEEVMRIAEQYPASILVEPSPRPGHLRICIENNEVYWAVVDAGGLAVTAKALDVGVYEVEKWIDEHYVPDQFATKFSELSGYPVCAIQEATYYFFNGGLYWPRNPSDAELRSEDGVHCFLDKNLIGSTTCCDGDTENGDWYVDGKQMEYSLVR